MALMTTVTLSCNSGTVRQIVNEFSSEKKSSTSTSVCVNGDPVIETERPEEVYKVLKEAKRSGLVHVHTAIAWYVGDRRISVTTEAGRCTRPLFVVRPDFDIRGKNWNACVMDGTIEYLDVEECRFVLFQKKHGKNARYSKSLGVKEKMGCGVWVVRRVWGCL
jgi:hypothetical protein